MLRKQGTVIIHASLQDSLLVREDATIDFTHLSWLSMNVATISQSLMALLA